MPSDPSSPPPQQDQNVEQSGNSGTQSNAEDAKSAQEAQELTDAAVHALVAEGDRRRSGRVRHVPKEFVPEPIKPKASRTIAKVKPKKKEEPKPSLIVKVAYVNPVPRPAMSPIQLDCSLDVFWLRLNLREFLLRFDKLCRLPTRHATTVNDPLQPWNDYLYKATVVALFRLIENDTVPIFDYARHYLSEIEHTPAESSSLWNLVYEFLEQSDPYLSSADELTGEHYRLELIRRLMVLATGTETIRLTILNDHEQLRQLQMDQGDKIKSITAHLSESVRKLEKLKSSDSQLYFDRVAAAERTAADKKFRAQQTLHSQTHKYTLRTTPLGRDSEGNIYWNFQQKSKDIPSWGTWIVCEMVWPEEMDEKKIKAVKQRMAQIFKSKKKAGKDKAAVESANVKNGNDAQKNKRKPLVPPKHKILCYVAGKENIEALASWIKNQLGHNNEKLVSDIQNIARYIQE